MKIKQSLGSRAFDVFNIVFMIFLMFITLYPFWYVVTCSFSESTNLIGARGLMFLPKGFSMDAYRAVMANPNILTGYKNTLIVVCLGTTINILMTSVAAFVLTRRGFAIRKCMLTMILVTMYFSGGMIPTYLVVFKYLKLGDSLWALMLPGAISTYNLVIMRTNFSQIPRSLEEAAEIDGANEFVVLFRIILPLSLPILAVMVLFYGVSNWNAWFNAMLYIRTPEKYPLQIRLREILLLNESQNMSSGTSASDRYSIGESIKYATIIVATVPILCVYPFVQKYFVKGIMVGAVKE